MPSPAQTFFSDVLPRALARRRALAARVGGRIGFVVGPDEWLVDLDHGVVSGGGTHRAVEEADPIDAVVSLAPDELAAVLQMGSPLAVQLLRGDVRVVKAFAQLLEATR